MIIGTPEHDQYLLDLAQCSASELSARAAERNRERDEFMSECMATAIERCKGIDDEDERAARIKTVHSMLVYQGKPLPELTRQELAQCAEEAVASVSIGLENESDQDLVDRKIASAMLRTETLAREQKASPWCRGQFIYRRLIARPGVRRYLGLDGAK